MTNTESVQTIASELYAFLALKFPVCCSSDEFFYFPQALSPEVDWSAWDDLSPEGVGETLSVLKSFRTLLADHTMDGKGDGKGDSKGDSKGDGKGDGGEDKTDSETRRLLSWHVDVLTEQLEDVKLHTTRPTFILTVATTGLIQALQSPEENALCSRLATLPAFLEKTGECMEKVPALFKDLGFEMADGLESWIATLENDREKGQAIDSVRIFKERLSRTPTANTFLLDRDLLERIAGFHSGSGITVSEALAELEDEEREMASLLAEESFRLACTYDFSIMFGAIKPDPLPGEGRIQLLTGETARLKEHCAALGVQAASSAPEVDIRFLPQSLTAVRAADSYSARPGNPYPGGTFYIFGGGTLGKTSRSVHPSYRMTVAHETYPGHHLLDTCRWNHPDPARRPLEYPLYYEGWACFVEDLMHRSGAFGREYDRFLLSWRRYRHAVRGRTDLLLHSGRIDLEKAATRLVQAGFDKGRAMETARKYALQPFYQMCYTIGHRRFQVLLDSFRGGGIPDFMNTVLSKGELLFDDLEKVLTESGARSQEKRP